MTSSPEHNNRSAETGELPPDELDYTQAPGSGAAATLAFIHLTAAGMLAAGSYYLLRHASEGLLSSWALWWQFFLPMGVGILTYLPTNPMSKAVALAARLLAWLGVAALLLSIFLVVREPARQTELISWGTVFSRLLITAAAGFGAGWALRHLFTRFLPKRDPSAI